MKIVKKELLVLAFLLPFMSMSYAADTNKQELKVLYVGYSPERGMPVYNARIAGYASEKRFVEDVKNRMNEFRDLLARYFTEVVTVDARDYRQEMSKEVDVTVFDALPSPIMPRKDVRDESGKYLRTESEKYLSPDFDCPTVFIAHTGGILQQGLDLKIDWCCLCLGAYALQVRTTHEVFHKPFPVELTFEQRTTPYTVYHYLNGYAQPDMSDMWKVQTSSYRDGKDQRIGLVSFGEGFDDSPDAEVISGGESLKAINTVAIGRHANFLLWGFGASPCDLTPEAQTVFANCVAYISRFQGQGPVMRKSRTVMTARDFADDLLWVVSPDGYQQYVHKKQLINAERLQQRKKAEQKAIEEGKMLDAAALDKKYPPSEILIQDEFYRTFLGKELGEMAVHGREKCRKYILACRPYFYGAGSFNQFVVDEDARYLKISNQDQRMLEKSIVLWEKGRDVELAKRILLRYTDQQFQTPREWRIWYEQNKKNLFFTEAGGYKFLENVQQNKTADSVNLAANFPPVSVSAQIIEKEDKRYVCVSFKMQPGYHIYAEESRNTPFVVTSLTIECPSGIQAVGPFLKPAGVLLEGTEEVMVYEGKVQFFQEITGVSREPVRCKLTYQCCNDLICMPPVEETVIVK